MINRDKSGLLIFDNFQIDWNLPKHKTPRYRTAGVTPPESDSDSGSANPERMRTRFDRRMANMAVAGTGFLPMPTAMATVGIAGASGTSTAVPKEPSKPNLFERIFHRRKLKRLHEENEARKMEDMAKANAPNFTVEEIAEPTEQIPIYEFFAGIKGTAEELQLATDRFQNYESAVAHLKKTGQTALLEMMEHQLEIHSAETRLYALGFRKVVTEANLVDFASKTKKGLCLDWIKNFARSIPTKAVEVKSKVDENNIFDNFVILHFDPMKDGRMLTLSEREKEEGKDPILFGVIAGSNKLYYLADWIDEYCDLTFDKLVEKIGADAISANDLTATVQQVVE